MIIYDNLICLGHQITEKPWLRIFLFFELFAQTYPTAIQLVAPFFSTENFEE